MFSFGRLRKIQLQSYPLPDYIEHCHESRVQPDQDTEGQMFSQMFSFGRLQTIQLRSYPLTDYIEHFHESRVQPDQDTEGQIFFEAECSAECSALANCEKFSFSHILCQIILKIVMNQN